MAIGRLILVGGALCAFGLGYNFLRRKIERIRLRDEFVDRLDDQVTAPSGEGDGGRAQAPPPAHSNGVAPEGVGGDALVRIKGIGPVYAKLLHGAGITTFAALGAMTPEKVQQIVAPKGKGAPIDPAAWIAQARRLSQG